jgi:hypothetical protein
MPHLGCLRENLSRGKLPTLRCVTLGRGMALVVCGSLGAHTQIDDLNDDERRVR